MALLEDAGICRVEHTNARQVEIHWFLCRKLGDLPPRFTNIKDISVFFRKVWMTGLSPTAVWLSFQIPDALVHAVNETVTQVGHPTNLSGTSSLAHPCSPPLYWIWIQLFKCWGEMPVAGVADLCVEISALLMGGRVTGYPHVLTHGNEIYETLSR